MNETGDMTLLPENYSDKVLAILLGVADGATHAREDIDPGATELLALYLGDGLLEALEWANDGVASDEAACMWLAALRCYRTLTGAFPDGAPEPLGRWIDEQMRGVEIFEQIHPGDQATLDGLKSHEMGQPGRPVNPGADSTGVLPRAAIAALLGRVPMSTTESLARAAAFFTHDDAAARSCVAAAKIIRLAMQDSVDSAAAWPELLDGLAGAAAHGLREVTERVALNLHLDPSAAYDAYFADDSEDEAEEPAAPRDPEADAYAVALLAALHGTDAIGERPASAVDDIVSELHERWMAILLDN